MGNKILENSRLISYIIELTAGLIVGVLLIIFFINLGFHYFAFSPHKKIVLRKNITASHKVKTNTTSDKFISQFYNTLVNNSGNSGNYLSSKFKNYLISTYGYSDYTNDIELLLSLNVLPQKINFYMNFANYSTVYVQNNNAVVYFNIYFTKVGNSFIISDITLSEG